MSRLLLHIIALSLLCITAPFVTVAQYGFDTVVVYFDIGKDRLLPDAIHTLDSTAQELKAADRKILIYGYADYLGTGMPNQTLSNARAQKVRAYLLKKKVPTTSILQTTGVGQVTERGSESNGNQQFRKVEIFVKRLEGEAPITFKTKPGKLSKLIKIKKTGETFVLEDVFFHYNSSRLTDASMPIVNELLQVMLQNPQMRIGLEGHVCCVEKFQDAWDEDYNDVKLSKNRSKTIYDFLIKNGVGKDRVSYRGYGKSQPIADPELTEEDKGKNRRVEVRMLKPLEG